MKAVVLLLTLLLAVRELRGQCSRGCLSCRKTSPITFECSVCDLHNNFAMNEDMQCVEAAIADCEIASADHTTNMCLRCKSGFVFDAEQKKCVQVGEFHKVDNCEYYLGLNHCQQCESGFYIKDGLCKALGDSSIDGCASYNADLSQCLACDAGKFVKANVCEAITKVDNCSLYSQTICDSCSVGYLHERNYYSSADMNAKLAHEIVLNQQLNVDRVMPPLPSVCIQQNIQHCLTYVNFSFCGKCMPGYYLDAERNCSENPDNEIPNCETYSDEETCSECTKEFFLGSNKCHPRTMVDHCEDYEVNSSVCVKCDDMHFLQSSGAASSCEERVLSKHIEFCEKRAPSADECAMCRDRFLATSDNLACRFHIENCNTYVGNTNFATDVLRCDICENGFYATADKGACKPQDIINCHTYKPNENECVECNNGFYFNGTDDECVARTALNCLTVSPTMDKCLSCIEGFFLKSDVCHKYTVTNCETLVADEDQCSKCFENHFLKDHRCYEYNVVGCLDFSATENHCSTCNSGFYLENHLCVKINLLNCLQAADDANQCKECESGYFLDSHECKKIYVPNCKIPSTTFNRCNDGQCEDGFWFKSADGSCQKISQPNCKTVDQTNGQCSECEDGFIQESGTATNPCIRQYKPFCKEFTTNTLTCSECEDNYYVQDGSCYPQNFPGCKSYVNNTSPNCDECIEGFYLDASDTKCYPYTVSHCQTVDPARDKCTKCFTDFLLQDQGLTCIKPSVPFCASVSTTVLDECATCVEGYGLNAANRCVPIHLEEHCLIADAASGADSSKKLPCKVCASGYFPDTSLGGCKVNAQSNCVQKAFNEDKCTICESLFFPTSGSCGNIANHADCLYSNGVDDKCLLCKPTFYLTAAGACTENSTTVAASFDDLCVGNSSATEFGCTVCKEGLLPYTMASTMTLLYVPNCIAFGTTNCSQCLPGYKLGSNTCILVKNKNIICNQKVADNTDDLDTANDCVECANKKKYYLNTGNSNTCTARTKPVIDGCEKYYDEADECELCETGKGFYGNTANYGTCIDNNRLGASDKVTFKSNTKIENCLIYDYKQLGSGLECLVCAQGFKVSGSGTCERHVGTSFAWDGTNLGFMTADLESSPVITGLVPGLAQEKVEYMKCPDGFMTIVGPDLTPDNTITSLNGISVEKVYTAFDHLTGTFTHIANRVQISACVAMATVSAYKYFVETDHASTPTVGQIDVGWENCLLAMKDNASAYFCIMCKENFLPRIAKIKNHQGSGTDDYQFSAVTCLERTEEFVKKYKVVSPPNLNTGASLGLALDDLLNFDSCADGRTLVAAMRYDADHFYWDTILSSDSGRPVMLNPPGFRCANDIESSAKVVGCHIYAVQVEKDPEADSSAVCMACKPGFKATVTSNKNDITACDKIANCDVSDPSKNTWMNSCETCLPGYGWVGNSTNMTIETDTCQRKSEMNCKIWDSSSVCLVCDKGYELTYSNLCKPLRATANGCQKFGHGANFWTLGVPSGTNFTGMGLTSIDPSQTASKMHSSIISILTYIYNDGSETANGFGCLECSGDIPPVGLKQADVSSTKMEACLESNFSETQLSGIANCTNLIYQDDNTSAAACGRCAEGYVAKNDQSGCVASTNDLQACILTKSGDDTKCAKCEEGYYLDNNEFCVNSANCDVWDSTNFKCAICKKGYMPDFQDSDERKCIEAPGDDTCSKWSFPVGCIECYNGNTPINVRDSLNLIFAKCPEKAHKKNDDSTDHLYKGAPFVISTNGTTWISASTFDNLPLLGMKTDTVTTSNAPSYACVPAFGIPNCEKYGEHNLCKECEEGYFKASNFSCLPGNLTGCISYAEDAATCALCGAGFFNNAGACTARATNLDCLLFDQYSDKCTKCFADQYLDENGSCQDYAVDNCADRSLIEDKCIKCLPGYTWNSSKDCVVIDNPKCALQLADSTGCMRCLPGYFMDANGICQRYSSAGCKLFRKNRDQCNQCEDDFFLEYSDNSTSADVSDDVLKCTQRKNTGCLLSNPTADECVSCQPGLFLAGNACKPYTVRNCSLFNEGANECVDCLEGFFRDADKNCVANSDPNCKVMGKYNSRCLVCKDGSHFDSNSKKCKLNTKSCQTFNPHADSCLTCEEGLWNDAGTCKRYKALNCRVYSTSADRCASCVDRHWMKADGNCLATQDPNCRVLQNYSDSCLSCYEGYFINSKKKCQTYTVNHCKYFNQYKNACLSCNAGYYLDNDLDCVPNTQMGCLGYVENMNKCATCQPGYYYSSGQCKEYTVEHCRRRDPMADNCLTCEEGTFKYKNTCQQYSVSHCKTFAADKDACATCPEDRYMALGQCMEYTVEDCKDKHPMADMCVECEGEDFFRNGLGKCQRVTTVDHCDKYHKTLDKCVECDEGFFMKDQMCLANPSGVHMCKSYVTEKLCGACEAPYYLKENKCLMSSVVIPLCEHYNFDANCGNCTGTAFLISNACQAVTNTTCAEWSSPENCSKCGVNRVLNTAGSTVICEDSGIADCMDATYSTEPITTASTGTGTGTTPTTPAVTNICNKCMPGFYLKDNACTATSTVADCSEYESETLCSKCNPGFILSTDKLTCSAIGGTAGANCSVGRMTPEPECIVCKEGFFFNAEGVCTECNVTGCAICDVINLRKCRLCKSGFQMTELFYCEAIGSASLNTTGPSKLARTVQEEDVQEDNGLRLWFFGYVWAMLALLFGFRQN